MLTVVLLMHRSIYIILQSQNFRFALRKVKLLLLVSCVIASSGKISFKLVTFCLTFCRTDKHGDVTLIHIELLSKRGKKRASSPEKPPFSAAEAYRPLTFKPEPRIKLVDVQTINMQKTVLKVSKHHFLHSFETN